MLCNPKGFIDGHYFHLKKEKKNTVNDFVSQKALYAKSYLSLLTHIPRGISWIVCLTERLQAWSHSKLQLNAYIGKAPDQLKGFSDQHNVKKQDRFYEHMDLTSYLALSRSKWLAKTGAQQAATKLAATMLPAIPIKWFTKQWANTNTNPGLLDCLWRWLNMPNRFGLKSVSEHYAYCRFAL